MKTLYECPACRRGVFVDATSGAVLCPHRYEEPEKPLGVEVMVSQACDLTDEDVVAVIENDFGAWLDVDQQTCEDAQRNRVRRVVDALRDDGGRGAVERDAQKVSRCADRHAFWREVLAQLGPEEIVGAFVLSEQDRIAAEQKCKSAEKALESVQRAGGWENAFTGDSLRGMGHL